MQGLAIAHLCGGVLRWEKTKINVPFVGVIELTHSKSRGLCVAS